LDAWTSSVKQNRFVTRRPAIHVDYGLRAGELDRSTSLPLCDTTPEISPPRGVGYSSGMIRRDAGADFLLITQHDHALLAGALARRLGNPPFTPPSPFEEVVDAIDQHDCGWPLHDDHPALNPSGLPLHVFEAPVPLAIEVWSASVQGAMQRGDYQGLLVSLHVMGLSAIFLSNSSNPSRPDLFEMNKFQHRQSEVQDTLRQRVALQTDVPLRLGLPKQGASAADDQLLFNFRLLTAMDRLSLELCCGKPLFPTLDDVHARPGGATVPMTTSMPQPDTLCVAPWPFQEDRFTLQVPSRRLAKTPFPDTETFRRAYDAAEREMLTLHFVPAQSVSS
jgi:hypothetical protein